MDRTLSLVTIIEKKYCWEFPKNQLMISNTERKIYMNPKHKPKNTWNMFVRKPSKRKSENTNGQGNKN